MATQQIINHALTCKTTGITASTPSNIPVYLADSDNATDPKPTVGVADGTNSDIYGKMQDTFQLGDVTSVVGRELRYALGANVVIDGIVEFTKASASDAADIGLGVVGAANNQVDTAATGTGKVVARNGRTLWVDLRA